MYVRVCHKFEVKYDAKALSHIVSIIFIVHMYLIVSVLKSMWDPYRHTYNSGYSAGNGVLSKTIRPSPFPNY